VDGLDPVATYRVMHEAVERARSGGGPTLIEATCLRMVPHTSDDDDRYRSEEERAAILKADPLPAYRKRLIVWGVADEERLAGLDAQIYASVREAEERALALPLVKDALSHIYVDQPPRETR
jgi:TPP-dependent pyruvate/acetoin dehydrogenase alpha subunit